MMRGVEMSNDADAEHILIGRITEADIKEKPLRPGTKIGNSA